MRLLGRPPVDERGTSGAALVVRSAFRLAALHDLLERQDLCLSFVIWGSLPHDPMMAPLPPSGPLPLRGAARPLAQPPGPHPPPEGARMALSYFAS